MPQQGPSKWSLVLRSTRMAPPLRKRVKRAVRSLVLRGLVRLVSMLPLGAALALGTGLGRLAWLVARGQRRLVLEHLAIAFPDRTEDERRCMARANLIHLCQLAMEVVTIRQYADRIEEYVSFAPGSEDVIRGAMARGRGIVFACGHIGNWELSARRVAPIVRPNAAIAKENADWWLNRALTELRAEAGITVLWREHQGTARELIRLFRQGGGLAILMDQDTRVQGVFVPFFGRLAFTPRAVADLALRFGAAIVVVTCHRRGPLPGHGHEIEAVELTYAPSPADKEAEVVRLIGEATAIQEAAIRKYPAEWVWMHRRWKTRPEIKAPSKGNAEKL